MAKLKGIFLKTVIGSLMSEKIQFPAYKKMIEDMKNDAWYSWDLYTQMLQDLSKKIDPVILTSVAMNIVLANRNVFVKEQGFDTLEKLLKDCPEMFSKTVIGLPENERVKLIKCEPGHAIMHYTVRQPLAFNEGVIKGFFSLYNKPLNSFKINQVNKDYFEIEVCW